MFAETSLREAYLQQTAAPRFAALLMGLFSALALLGARLLERFLFGVPPTDPKTYVGTVLAMLAVATLASALPAWRAARRSPVEALAED
ncbi:MAG: hypothetical protein WD995_10860 [Gemmatimonadota bacterium]